MGIDDEFPRGALVKIRIALWRIIQVMTVALTALAMWMRSWRIAIIKPRLYFMTGVWPVNNAWDLAHPRPKRMLRLPFLAAASLRAGVFRDVETRDADRAGGARRFHQLIEHGCGFILAALSLRFEADAINGAIHFGHAQDLLDTLRDRAALRQIDRFASERTRLRETLLVEVGDDDD